MMPDDVANAVGVVGPNAVLQLVPILDRLGGQDRRAAMFAQAGIFEMPDGTSMIPETAAARLHAQIRRTEPEMAPALTRFAGIETANYILRHRIPPPVQWVLKALPKRLAASLLSQAIAQHAWTFVGSGTFTVVTPWTFEIAENPLIRGEESETCLCDWHAGVFTRLYQALVAPDSVCIEAHCCAQSPALSCRFEITKGAHA